jgi:hypothetical protein
MQYYQDMIRRILVGERRSDIDVRHAESWIRELAHGPLDHFTTMELAHLTRKAIKHVDHAGKELSERFAQSMGI